MSTVKKSANSCIEGALTCQGRMRESRIRAAHFPACKTGEDFDFTYQTSVR